MAQLRLNVEEADSELPMVCMKCGEPATVVRTKKMAWHPRWVLVLIVVHVLIYAIVALILTKRARLQAPLCDEHKGHWRNRQWILGASLLVLIAFVFGAIVVGADLPRDLAPVIGPYLWIGGIALFIGWIILVGVLQHTAIRPQEITATEITLENVSEDFIQAVVDRDSDRRRRAFASDDDWDEDDDEPAPRPQRSTPDAIAERPLLFGKPPDAIEE